jgi:hypothetical protein
MADLSQLQEAAAAVRHSPHAVSAWEEVEGLAAELDRPDDIVRLYTDVLAGDVEPQVAEMIGERIRRPWRPSWSGSRSWRRRPTPRCSGSA